MAILKKYNLAGAEIGKVEIADDLLETSANSQMVKDYLVAIRNNARQWSAHTKTRSEVNHSGKKPHPQKGTGRARQGYLGAPQYKGGGRVHAPRAKFDQHVSINKKERRAAIRQLIQEKILDNKLHVLQVAPLKEPKTKTVAQFLETCKFEGKRVLFLAEGFLDAAPKNEKAVAPSEKYELFLKSLRNIPKVNMMLFPNVSGYDIAVNHELVILEPAMDELMVILGGSDV
ncbi:MAG: 50S ribosomal protein L4 [Chlamydiales bacterium]|nr:50S ribosomal protein L4 [Chlamydiales bacterium]